MHRDIKVYFLAPLVLRMWSKVFASLICMWMTCISSELQGANILVDNKGCIKLADFGASKQVVELVRIFSCFPSPFILFCFLVFVLQGLYYCFSLNCGVITVGNNFRCQVYEGYSILDGA